MAILNHARSSQSRVSSFAWPDFGPRAVRFQAARVRLTDPPARAAFFFGRATWSSRRTRPNASLIIISRPLSFPRETSSSHTEDDGNNDISTRRKKDTTSRPRSLRPHATETRPKRDVPCVRAKTWDVFLERICEEYARASRFRYIIIQRAFSDDLDSEI